MVEIRYCCVARNNWVWTMEKLVVQTECLGVSWLCLSRAPQFVHENEYFWGPFWVRPVPGFLNYYNLTAS